MAFLAIFVSTVLLAGLLVLVVMRLLSSRADPTGPVAKPLPPTERVSAVPRAILEGADEEDVTEETLHVGAARPLLKKISGPPGSQDLFYLSPTGVTHIGRDPKNDIVLPEPQTSSRHCRVAKEGSYYVLTDLNSSNKVEVNGVVKDRTVLRNGDRIKVGQTTLIFALFGDRA